MATLRMFVFAAMMATLTKSGSIEEENSHPFEFPPPEKFEAGREALEKYRNYGEQSACWREAVAKIETSCNNLRDIDQSFLAIDFTNCHLGKSGRKTYPCDRSVMDVRACTQDMDDAAFDAYTTFFAHTSNMCYFLSSQAWQERTEDTITKLSGTSEKVVKQLTESSEKQLVVLEQQNISLENQKKIIRSEMHLTETLESSTRRAREAFKEMHYTANEQKALFSETFDSIFKRVETIRQLQSMLLGEFISLQSLAFHVVAVCVCYFFTSTPRTAGARLILFIGLAVLIGLERLVTSWSIVDDETTETTEVLHSRLWFCRKVFIMLAAFVLMIVGYQYKDYSRVNFDMLLEIQRQVRELSGMRSTQGKVGALTNGEQLEQRPPVIHLGKSFDAVDCLQMEDEESDSSYDSSEAGSESFFTESEEEDRPEEPEKLSGEMLSPLQATKNTPETLRCKQDMQPYTPSTQSPSHRYNLRPRRSTPCTPLNRSYTSNMPSPRTLSELIQNLKRSTSRQYTAVARTRESGGTALFSSDEES